MPRKTAGTAPQCWSLPGPVENWGTGIERKVWGMRPHFAKTWERLSPGDVLFFYVAAPVGGVVGYGQVTAKFKGDAPLWPDEIKEARVLYPYRFEFDINRVLEPRRWTQDRLPVRDLGIVTRAIGRVPPDKASKLLARMDEKWGSAAPPPTPPPERPRSRHDQAKDLLLDVGRMSRYVCADEYRLDGERLDAVWKRVEHGVPTYAFEVQIGGDIYHAIGKLKHAFDLWNSRIFIVIDGASIPKVAELLRGTFHEIANELRVIELEKLESLQRALATVHELEKELGLS